LNQVTRRSFLKFAGGVTFLSLVPTNQGLFAAPASGELLPLFTVVPYIQPGPASKLAANADTLVVAWQTELLPADFEVTYGVSKAYINSATVVRSERVIGPPDKVKTPQDLQIAQDTSIVDHRYNYRAHLSGLKLGQKYYYRVKGNGQILAEGYATTRKPRGEAIRFAAFGDNSYGDLSDKAIAYQAYLSKPDFVMNTGDNVYESGLDNEYTRYFFPVYNADVASPRIGAPLLRSVPFYTVIANHDVKGKTDSGMPVADFNKDRDSLGYYTAMSLPLNGPAYPASPTPVVGDDAKVMSQFRDCAAERFPAMANYSYDYGDAHFLCLDSNDYVDPTNVDLQAWIESDLSGTDAIWKFVVFHHPPFNVGEEHYSEQQMRALTPLFERHGVDLALHGHEHTYQRTMPIEFAPTDLSKAAPPISDGDDKVKPTDRLVPGAFTIDTEFDGIKNTKPKGIIYITSGAGGRALYEPNFTDSPNRWKHAEDNNVAYIAKFHSNRHSLTLFEIDGPVLKMAQVDEAGLEIDHITITKS